MNITENLNEENVVTISNNPVDMGSIELDDINTRDYPDFVDAYISAASFEDGTDLTDKELDQLNNEQSDLVHELAHDSFH